MGAFTAVTKVKGNPATAGGDGLKPVVVTCTGPASYDAAGSVCDLSAICKDKVYFITGNIDNADLRVSFVPGTSYSSADCKLFVDDNAGGEATGDLSTTMATTELLVWGTDA